MAKWESYFKIVEPQPERAKMADSSEMADSGAYNNYTWYQRLIQGSASRMSRYREYDLMDSDIEVSRALDTIAEEMTGNSVKTDEALELQVLTENYDNTQGSAILTAKTALQRWCRVHDWENRLFRVARMTAKYGDCFFRKMKNKEQWVFVHPKNVIAAVVDQNDATNVLAWQVKKDIKRPRDSTLSLGSSQDSQYESEIVDANEMVRFTLNDDMSDTAPFGESVLRPVYRAHKQKELLEDAIIIYRVQRAPERRVFHVDVGKMPPQRVKQYLESIKNEIKQKKIPSYNGGQQEVDSVYNPQSMSEDFFFACISLKTNIFLLDGRTLSLQDLINEYNEGKDNWTYTVDQQSGRLVPGKISWAGITRRDADMVRVHLDNGETIDCTPDHKFVLRDGSEVQAQNLAPETSLMPLYKKKTKTNKDQKEERYERVLDNATGKWRFTHLEVHPKQEDTGTVVHHCDYNPSNNNPTNLIELTHEDHWKYHHSVDGHTLGYLWRNNREKMLRGIANYHANRTPEQTETIRERNKINGRRTWELHADKVRVALNKGREHTRNKFDSYEEYCEYMANNARSQWTVEKREKRSQETKNFNKETKSYNIDDTLFSLFVNVYNQGNDSMPKMKSALTLNHDFIEHFKQINPNNQNVKHGKPLNFSDKFVYKLANYGGYNSFNEFKQSYAYNHTVVFVEHLTHTEDTGCLYVTDPDDNHNFAVAAGVYIKNSRPDGRGSRVETLPGGQNLGDLTDLNYFQKKVWRGLKVPSSYMAEQNDGGQMFNDGKVGVAYIEELRFALFIGRLQGFMEKVLDDEFKKFLRIHDIQIDDTLYRVRLPDPSNFGKYRQQELDQALLGTYGTADGVQYLSKRFIMERFLQMSDEEIIKNERMKREEMGLDPDSNENDLPKIYGEEQDDMGGMGMGGLGGGELGGGFGGEGLGMEAGGEEMGAEGGEGMDTGAEPGGET